MEPEKPSRWHVLALAVAIGGCTTTDTIGGPVRPGEIADGIYEGHYAIVPDSARVRVAVRDGRIVSVVLLEHHSAFVGDEAAYTIPGRIVEAQSTDVDVVTGATRSSHVIMNAVEMALSKARR
jgi:uncharacterized protein with FMN-binding domain